MEIIKREFSPDSWTLHDSRGPDQTIVGGSVLNFVDALMLMFAAYYCVNISYRSELGATLEFLQRCFLGINPETGSKAKKRHGNSNPHVSTFFRKIVDFEWMSV
ncbi:hypothetical protein NQZ68_000712 [Dissostichus eleginoides]|nr:hypothetical protein NQZ68_000712 [Dissostichus eleginoides]